MVECILILAGAFLLDLALGDPVYRFHPVRLLGHLVAWLEKTLFSLNMTGFGGGSLLFAGSLLGAAVVFLGALALWIALPLAGLVVFMFLVYSSIGFRDLFDHALPVEAALTTGDSAAAQRLLQRIVGRDVSQLDHEGMTRAAVETVAENFVDGFLSVLFWFTAGALAAHAAGLPPAPAAAGCAMAYRVVNTLDAMVGYRNPRYETFGTLSARTDDVLNFIPARLSVLIIALAAAICRMDPPRCLKTAIRDRLAHVSPNAGHTESCVAGALGIRLGGPVRYPGKTVEKPWMGDNLDQPAPSHISQTCRLIFCAGWIAVFPSLFIFARLM